MQFTRPVEVKETLDAFVTENADGLRQLKQYILKQEIGKGAFGKVHLGVDENTGTPYAVKEFSKSKLRKKDKTNLFKLGPRGRGRGMRGPSAPSPTSTAESSPLDLIRGEIAILKKLNHPNIVKLYEVLDVANDDSMYMVFEFCEKGVLMPVSLTKTFNKSLFTDEMCRDLFQQIVLGIEYLHEHDIIHRDIKPDNLLLTEGNIVKIVDFGVSEMFDKKGNDMTKKSAGSPAFMAPELCRHDHGEVSGRATDIWSMGVTLYCLRYGRLPYVSESILEMQRIIHLIEGLLEKDPTKRVTIDQLRDDPWLTNNGNDQLISKEENTIHAVTEVTEEDLRGAIQKINGLVTVVIF
ncbi:kinase-like domain-containing protein [Lobosporangium transversale]|uniref:Kinase-like domain-containing protein n=1 Tax=Lobosporangium transversale TaxID=64571 RepID=A0A1Y2GZY3_9FUNG|nr:kinase-like domain-containing protein [Lobosporangium transversale]ORZ27836.1 kinase-like domain-containing protein [Lobosporangium transversale]|eukprot:XP_021885539.1 kinase-like domain-containing protein [Lobosporangium transversale]